MTNKKNPHIIKSLIVSLLILLLVIVLVPSFAFSDNKSFEEKNDKMIWNDLVGKVPIYVSFGASTTIGAVHHFDGEDVTYSQYSYPEFVGNALGLETHNLGQGTTGFVARDKGKKPNYMDSIYRNGKILEKASLITLMFGYGNDRTVGLPVGEWDDYYPYDEYAHFFIEGDTGANIDAMNNMLEEGATLFGCLNWCIKWLGENYPQAELIVICGAPSGNFDKTISVVTNDKENAGTKGISPQKLIISSSQSGISIKFSKLKEALNIPAIDLFTEGLPFSYYSTFARNDDGTYVLFSTKGNNKNESWNSHPNDMGYLLYARYLTGRIASYFNP